MVVMKRLHLITKPINLTGPASLAELDQQAAEEKWLLEAALTERKRMRRFKRRLATQ